MVGYEARMERMLDSSSGLGMGFRIGSINGLEIVTMIINM